MQARYYDPVTARFLSGDPVGFAEGGPAYFNKYAYVNNDPMNATDPTGRNPAIDRRFEMLNSLSPQAKLAVANTIIDFTPIVGDAKAIGQAIANPTSANIASAAIGLAPGIGDLAGKSIKAAAQAAGNGGDAARAAPDFIVTSKGDTIPIPDNASGPRATINKRGNEVGFEFTGGSGGKGMDTKVDGVRIMDANNNQGRRASFMNRQRQKIDPTTGRTVSNSGPNAHFILDENN